MSFAALQSRANLAARARLGNATASWWAGGVAAGAPVAGLRVVFDRETSGRFADQSVVDAQPVASLLAMDAPGLARRDALHITPDGVTTAALEYTVQRVEADGLGWVQVYLTEAAS